MELARAKRALVLSKKKIQQIGQTRKGVVTELDARQAEGLEVNRYRIYAAYLKGLGKKIESENEHFVEISDVVRDKHEIAEASRISKETLQRLKQTQHAKYLQRSNRAEQKAADELVGLRKRPGVEDAP
jgi:flagellar export protein FliJ